MHAIPHALPHRGTGASRARPRWQPYSSLPSTSSRSPSSSYLNTPQTSVPTPISLETRPIHEPTRSALKQSATLAHPLKEGFVREAHKVRYVNGLVDHAVKSLSEIWDPNDIPAVFSTSSRQAVITSLANNPVHLAQPTPPHLHNAQNIQHAFTSRYTQLPSPTTPTHPTPVAFPVSIPSVRPAPLERTTTAIFDDPARNNAAPLKSFVHEVLRRSRTSSGVLQTALCYLEAIRHKVPDYVRQERQGHGTRGEADQSDRIVSIEKLDQSSVGGEVPLDLMDPSCFVNPDYIDSSAATIRIPDIVAIPLATPSEPSTQCPVSIYPPKKPKSENLTPLPPLPSPLLCPRRAFLAALILASKFMQDKCYSNRAWAKLAGLPPREIGRCERALGEALEWRLWVGKLPSKARSPVSRSASESGLVASSSGSSMSAPENFSMPGPSTLRRTSTVPANVFAPLVPQQPFGFSGPALMSGFPPMASMSTTSCVGDSVRLPARGMSILSDGTPPATPQLYASPSSTDSESSLETLPSEDERTIQIAGAVDSPSSPPLPFGVQMDCDMAAPPIVSDPTPKATTFAIPNMGNVFTTSGSHVNAPGMAFDAGWEWSGRW